MAEAMHTTPTPAVAPPLVPLILRPIDPPAQPPVPRRAELLLRPAQQPAHAPEAHRITTDNPVLDARQTGGELLEPVSPTLPQAEPQAPPKERRSATPRKRRGAGLRAELERRLSRTCYLGKEFPLAFPWGERSLTEEERKAFPGYGLKSPKAIRDQMPDACLRRAFSDLPEAIREQKQLLVAEDFKGVVAVAWRSVDLQTDALTRLIYDTNVVYALYRLGKMKEAIEKLDDVARGYRADKEARQGYVLDPGKFAAAQQIPQEDHVTKSRRQIIIWRVLCLAEMLEQRFIAAKKRRRAICYVTLGSWEGPRSKSINWYLETTIPSIRADVVPLDRVPVDHFNRYVLSEEERAMIEAAREAEGDEEEIPVHYPPTEDGRLAEANAAAKRQREREPEGDVLPPRTRRFLGFLWQQQAREDERPEAA